MWIIDTSGPTSEVTDAVEAIEYQSFRHAKTEQLERAQARRKLAGAGRPDLDQDVAMHEAELARMDDGDERMFTLAKAAVLEALSNIPTTHAGVCARAYKNPSDAPRGQTLSISVSGYDVR